MLFALYFAKIRLAHFFRFAPPKAEKKIRGHPVLYNNVLDEIRPFIEMDGGYLEYIAIDYTKDGPIVMVRMLGACAGCAMSAQTMTMGIEKLVKERFPEVIQVISV